MPKRTSKEQQQRWHQEFQQGASIAQLAKKHGRDPRTIERAVEEVERVAVAKQARTDLLKEGLRRHQEELLALLREAAAAAAPVPTVVDLRFPGVPPPPQLAMPGWTACYRKQDGRYHEVRLEVEAGFSWQLVLEHLGRDPALRALSGWKRAALAELNQRLSLRDHVAEYVARELGLRMSDDIHKGATIRPSALWAVYEAVVAVIVGGEQRHPVGVKLGDVGEFFVNDASGGFLPEGSQLPNKLATLPHAIEATLPALVLGELSEETGKRAAHAREGLLEVAQSYYLSGSCRSCRRFGA